MLVGSKIVKLLLQKADHPVKSLLLLENCTGVINMGPLKLVIRKIYGDKKSVILRIPTCYYSFESAVLTFSRKFLRIREYYTIAGDASRFTFTFYNLLYSFQ